MMTELDEKMATRIKRGVMEGRIGKPVIPTYGYDDITLIPSVVSTLEHRAEADTSIQLGERMLSLPLLAAPMPDVCGGRMARVLGIGGALGIVHRFQSIEDQSKQILSMAVRSDHPHILAGAVGVTGDWEERFLALYRAGARYICLDTANGANEQVEKVLYWIKTYDPKVFVIAGNVGSPRTFIKLEEWGADAIRVGIAGGSVCETRTETGIYTPMAWLVSSCFLIRDKALIIADGGIKNPGDFCKALAIGADAVMVGGALAGTDEAPGEMTELGGKIVKRMRGAASYSVQQDNGNGAPSYVEGRESWVDLKGPVSQVIARYRRGLQSSMSYMNARNLQEYRENVQIAFIGQGVG